MTEVWKDALNPYFMVWLGFLSIVKRFSDCNSLWVVRVCTLQYFIVWSRKHDTDTVVRATATTFGDSNVILSAEFE